MPHWRPLRHRLTPACRPPDFCRSSLRSDWCSPPSLPFITSLTFLPAVLLMMTSFTRIVIVLSLLRQALGAVQAPPNQVLVGLSLFLTFFVMSPVLERMYTEAYVPFSDRRIAFNDAV